MQRKFLSPGEGENNQSGSSDALKTLFGENGPNTEGNANQQPNPEGLKDGEKGPSSDDPGNGNSSQDNLQPDKNVVKAEVVDPAAVITKRMFAYDDILELALAKYPHLPKADAIMAIMDEFASSSGPITAASPSIEEQWNDSLGIVSKYNGEKFPYKELAKAAAMKFPDMLLNDAITQTLVDYKQKATDIMVELIGLEEMHNEFTGKKLPPINEGKRNIEYGHNSAGDTLSATAAGRN